MDNFYMEKLQASMKNSLESILSGNMSPRTLQTKLKENIGTFTQMNTQNGTINGTINETVGITDNIAKTLGETPDSGFSKWNIFKIILSIVVIGLLALNAFTYVTDGTDAFTYFLGPNDGEVEKVEEKVEKVEKVEDDKATTAVHSAIDIEAEKLSRDEKNSSTGIEQVIKKKKTNKKAYKANNLSDNVNKKSGFCYVGADRNVRTCVKVNESDTCMSGEVFPTRDICINPTLKE